ncbi:MAG: phosphate ABC transporter ATP-binding protein PstB [Dehalococcoidia bacterium]|nr:phosphate ABC transporter ATP-binding protein PstB [Dehalococcoidia bacterium]
MTNDIRTEVRIDAGAERETPVTDTPTEEQLERLEHRMAGGGVDVKSTVAAAAAGSPRRGDTNAIALSLEDAGVWYGQHQAVQGVTFDIYQRATTALIGPSGCGKSTLLRCFNRMNDLIPGARVTGKITIDGVDIMGKDVDAVQLRRHVGMVFQKPNPFPMSIKENIAFGPKRLGLAKSKSQMEEVIERSLRDAALWDEVKDKLDEPGTSLSGGQQQRLCIARVLAVKPDIILMDEPCSALDPIATLKIEDLMRTLAKDYTIVVVTHNMQQAARVSDWTAFLLAGEERTGRLIEYSPTEQLFTNPRDKRTEDYITGRFG